MPIADKDKTPLERMADKYIRGEYSVIVPAVRFSQLNPEQQLAYMLEQLIVVNKEKLALMESILFFAKECTEWRKTPEGVAWMAKQEKKRAEAEQAKGG